MTSPHHASGPTSATDLGLRNREKSLAIDLSKLLPDAFHHVI